MSKQLFVSSAVQKALLTEVLIPQMATGFWKDHRPADHAAQWADVDIVVSDSEKLGPVDFTIPRLYNFVNPAFIKPNESQTLELPDGKSSLSFRLPQELRSRNVLVQIVGGGRTASEPYYANTLTVTTSENYGHLLVRSAATGKPEPTVYVKVYARMQDGAVQFYKDGYTDLRGRFDYVSLSTNELENVQTFALLVLSDEHGAIVREAKPPQR